MPFNKLPIVTIEGAIDPTAFMRKYGGAIAHAIAPSRTDNRMDVKVLKGGRTSLALVARTDKRKRFIKFYGPQNSDAVASYRRERDALLVMGEIDLCPKLRYFSDAGQILITDYIEGNNFRDLVDLNELPLLCHGLGQWIGRYMRKAPRLHNGQDAVGNWFDYLQKYPDLAGSAAIIASRSMLQSFTYDHHILSKNDGALSNMMLSNEGKIFGIDFEHARYKPYGWDLLQAARALVRLFPQQTDLVTQELAQGFCDTAKGQADRYVALLRVFVIATAFSANLTPGGTTNPNTKESTSHV